MDSHEKLYGSKVIGNKLKAGSAVYSANTSLACNHDNERKVNKRPCHDRRNEGPANYIYVTTVHYSGFTTNKAIY